MDSKAYSRGADAIAVVSGRRAIMNDPNRSILDKVNDLAVVHHAMYDRPQESTGAIGRIMRIGMGAALGVGLARGIGSVLNLGSTFQNNLETAAMGLGAMMKSASDEQERRNFRIGFVKAAYEAGYFKKSAGLPILGVSPLTVGPEALLAVPRAASRLLISGSQAAGAGLGILDAANKGDVADAELETTRDLLRQRLEEAKSMKAQVLLKHILAKRKR